MSALDSSRGGSPLGRSGRGGPGRVDVIGKGPIATSHLLWRDGQGALFCTVIAKTTFELRPGDSPVVSPLPIQEVDAHWDDNPDRSVHVPSDVQAMRRGRPRRLGFRCGRTASGLRRHAPRRGLDRQVRHGFRPAPIRDRWRALRTKATRSILAGLRACGRRRRDGQPHRHRHLAHRRPRRAVGPFNPSAWARGFSP